MRRREDEATDLVLQVRDLPQAEQAARLAPQRLRSMGAVPGGAPGGSSSMGRPGFGVRVPGR